MTIRRTHETPAEAREASGPQPPWVGERLVHFPGFNAFLLNATVTGGGAHPYFAVMVAGSGPTDRDWRPCGPFAPCPR